MEAIEGGAWAVGEFGTGTEQAAERVLALSVVWKEERDEVRPSLGLLASSADLPLLSVLLTMLRIALLLRSSTTRDGAPPGLLSHLLPRPRHPHHRPAPPAAHAPPAVAQASLALLVELT